LCCKSQHNQGAGDILALNKSRKVTMEHITPVLAMAEAARDDDRAVLGGDYHRR
jgi:hypothetical protein